MAEIYSSGLMEKGRRRNDGKIWWTEGFLGIFVGEKEMVAGSHCDRASSLGVPHRFRGEFGLGPVHLHFILGPPFSLSGFVRLSV